MNTAGNRCCKGAVRNILCAALCAALYAPVPAAHAQSAASGESIRQYDIPAGSLSSALGAWGAQSDRQVVFAPDLVAGKQARGVSGQYGAEQALTQLLAGTGLAWKRVNSQTYALEKAPPPEPVDANQKPASKSRASSSAAAQKVTQLDTVSVTGTRIRGGVTASPTITIGAQQIQDEGFSDLGEVIRSIPQNFRGGQNPNVASGETATGIANQNVTGGSALNLRGLGPDATLTLLNGRRMSYGGFSQAVDISAIPVEAVGRIEIVPDGASAIYGSDAVGGVANVILKRNFNGVTIGTRFGEATQGGLITRAYTATAGTTWNSGGLIATFMKEDQDPIYATQRDYTSVLNGPTTIYPGHELRSGLFSLHQALGDNVELQLDALNTVRDQTRSTGEAGYYYLQPSEGKVSLVAPRVLIYLPGDWSLTTGFSSGQDRITSRVYTIMASGPPQVSKVGYNNNMRTWEIDAEGPLFNIGGNQIRLATGIGSRDDNLSTPNYLSGSWEGGSERSKYVYGELAIPLVSQQVARPGLRRLEFDLAARSEDYNSFSRVTTPKVGIIYDPSEDVTLKTSWGHSFKAPTLDQQYESRIHYLWSAQDLGGTQFPAGSQVLMSYGGNQALQPERARTWTTSVDFHPESLPRLDAELSYFRIDYTDRVVQPIAAPFNALSDPAYVPWIVYSPTEQQQQALIAEYGDAFYNFSGANYDPSKVVAIAYDQFTNVSRWHAHGFDLTGSYKLDLGVGELQLRGTASWLESSQQSGQGEAPVDLAGVIFNPAKLNSRIGAVWRSGDFSASGFVNYTQGVISRLALLAEKTASFTTFDATLSYDTGIRNGALSDILVSLSVQNMFNRNPPLYTVPSGTEDIYLPYDSTNYSAIGRYISVSISKHW